MATPEAYYNQHSRSYVEKWNRLDVDPGNPSNCFRRLLMDTILQISELQGHHNIVEVGCGTGLLLKEILEHTNRVYGVDISREMLGRAVDSTLTGRKALILEDASTIDTVASSGEVLLAVDDLMSLRLPRDYFDRIISLEVLRYIRDLDMCLANVLAIMKADSRFVFSVTNFWSFSFFPLMFRLRAWLGLVRKDELAQYFMTERALGRRLRRAGLEIVRCERLGLLLVNPWVQPFIKSPSVAKRIRDLDRVLTGLPIFRHFADTFVVTARKLPGKSHQ
ncbi:MAG TPA: class I SAM-dependent methyltransferase [Nitrospiraceae bacterium]|nr:class I SAM-dependent methyltransferase [Nitrospiraceae bacterium]